MKNIEYIFCINTGRSGSDYLTSLLSHSSETISIHEGFPIMNGIPMQLFNENDESELQKLMPQKINEIMRKKINSNSIYCETNHTYIKGWGYLIPEYIPQEKIGVIILKRNINKIVHSLLRVRQVPDSNEFNRTWYLYPSMKRNINIVQYLENPEDYCKWYVNEIYSRAESYKTKFKDITYFECDIEDLNNYSNVLDLFNTFNIEPSSELVDFCGTAVNFKSEWPFQSYEKLTEKPFYTNANDLSESRRQDLLIQIVDYVYINYSESIKSLKRDDTIGGSYAYSCINLYANIQVEIESKYKISLLYSELEYLIIMEILWRKNPYDFAFLFSQRCTDPYIFYKYDFNFVPSLKTVIFTLGLRGLLNLINVILHGMWGRDYTHRINE